jgi:hypothetical protein
MAFRVLIIGTAGIRDYPWLRDVLDTLLANRLPDVELLTTGGPGLPALVASYARSRGLTFTALVPDHERYPGNAVERRDALLVADADAAAVLVDEWYHPDMDRLVKAVRAKRGRVQVVGREKPRGKPVAARALWRPRGLPD